MRIFAFLVFVAFTTQSFAQSFEIQYGNPFAKEPSVDQMLINRAEGGAYATLFDGKASTIFALAGYIQHDDKPVSVKFESSTTEKKPRMLDIFNADGKSYLIYAAKDKQKNEDVAYLQEVGKSLDFTGAAVRLAAFKTPKGIGNGFGLYSGDIVMEDFTDLTIVKPASQDFFVLMKRRQFKIELVAWHPAKGQLWNTVFTMKDMEQRITSVVVSANGNFFLCGTYVNASRNELVDPFLMVYSSALKKSTTHWLKSGEKSADFGYKLKIIDGTPYLAGMYQQKSGVGYKLHSISPDGLALTEIATNPIVKEYYDVMHAGAFNPANFSVEGISKLENGNFVLDISGNYSQSINSYKPSVYVVCVNPSGEQWHTIIQKYQVQPNKTHMLGHVTMTSHNKVYLIYNDDIDNFSASPTVKQKEGLIKKNMYIAVVEIDENGAAKKLNVFSKDKSQKICFYTPWVIPVGDNTFQFRMVKDDKFQFATVKLTK